MAFGALNSSLNWEWEADVTSGRCGGFIYDVIIIFLFFSNSYILTNIFISDKTWTCRSPSAISMRELSVSSPRQHHFMQQEIFWDGLRTHGFFSDSFWGPGKADGKEMG